MTGQILFCSATPAAYEKEESMGITAELVIIYLIVPAITVYVAVRILKKLLSLMGKRKKIKAYKPNSRYYR